MAELRIVTLTGADAALGETVVERFGSGLRGGLLRPDGTVYDEARKVWNSLIDKHPALIARCTRVGDVVDSLSTSPTRTISWWPCAAVDTTSPAKPSATVAW